MPRAAAKPPRRENKMLKKLVWERYRKCTADDRAAFLAEAERMISEYGWQDMSVHPYGYPVKVTKILNDFRDFDICTKGSKEYLILLVNGLAEIMNAWEDYEMEPKVTIRVIENGKTVETDEKMARLLIAEGAAELA